MALSNFSAKIFSSLEDLKYKSFFTLLYFYIISCVCSKNNGEGHVEKGLLAIVGLLVRFLTLPSDSG